MDFETFTEKSKSVLQAAQTLAMRRGNPSLEPEHLAHVILEDQDGLIPRLITAGGGDPERLKRDVSKALAKLPSV